LRGHIGRHDQPVIPVRFEPRDGAIRRIARILADNEIEKRDHQIDDDGRNPRIDRQMREMKLIKAVRNQKWQRRAQKPDIAFAVFPRSGHGRHRHRDFPCFDCAIV
jgi:hypothetical protein